MITNSDRIYFLSGYAAAMAWANTRTGETYEFADGATATLIGDQYYITADSVPGACVHLDTTDAEDFLNMAEEVLALTGETDYIQHGHDFALTRNRHGAGFWDRGYPQDVSAELTALAHSFGEETIILS